MRQSTQGFSLVQLSVIVAAAGLITAAALPSQEGEDVNSRYLITKERMQKIEDATVNMMATWGRRPCPASGTYRPGQEGFGTEDNATADLCTDGDAPDGILNYGANVVAGTVPVRKLHLADEYAFDGWGRPFTYVVDTRATSKDSCVAEELIKGAVNITHNGTEVETMSALISHGPDGHGAFLPQGSTKANRFNTNSTDADQIKNAGGEADMDAATYANDFIAKERTATFDDFVWYSDRYKNSCCLGKICSTASAGPAEADDFAEIGGDITNGKIGSIMVWGNVNGDLDPVGGEQIYDLIFGNDPANPAAANKIYVLLGSKDPFPTPITLNMLDGTHANPAYHLGYTISTPGKSINDFATGDVNGDNITDIVMVGDGWLAAVFGTSTPLGSKILTVDVDGLEIDGASDGSRGFFITQSDDTYGIFGKSVAVGRVNHDDFGTYAAHIDDIVVGQYDLTTPLVEAKARGRVSLIWGRPTGDWAASYTNATILSSAPTGVAFDGWGYTTDTGNANFNANPAIAMGRYVAILNEGMDGVEYTAIMMTSQNADLISTSEDGNIDINAQTFIAKAYRTAGDEKFWESWGGTVDLTSIPNTEYIWISGYDKTQAFGKTQMKSREIGFMPYTGYSLTVGDGQTLWFDYTFAPASASPQYINVAFPTPPTWSKLFSTGSTNQSRFANLIASDANPAFVATYPYLDNTGSSMYWCDPMWDCWNNPSTFKDNAAEVLEFTSSSSPTFGSAATYIPQFKGSEGGALVIADSGHNNGGTSGAGAIYVMFDISLTNGTVHDFTAGPPGATGPGGGTTVEPY